MVDKNWRCCGIPRKWEMFCIILKMYLHPRYLIPIIKPILNIKGNVYQKELFSNFQSSVMSNTGRQLDIRSEMTVSHQIWLSKPIAICLTCMNIGGTGSNPTIARYFYPSARHFIHYRAILIGSENRDIRKIARSYGESCLATVPRQLSP